MKALTLIPGTKEIDIVDYQEPQITKPGQVKMKVLQVGICGTDREEASGGRAEAPADSRKLIIGHEMIGQVVEVGEGVSIVHKGDYGVFTVRRGCGKCAPCLHNRSDMCLTGEYTERGIKGFHGYQSEFVVDDEAYLVKVPASVKEIGVLTEPMSVAEKAIDEALTLQASRLPFFEEEELIRNKKVLIAGLGAIGLLLAFALRLRGAKVYGLDIVDENSIRPSVLKEIGGTYIDGKNTSPLDLDSSLREMDFIFEAAGVAKLQFELIDALGINGVYVLTGIPSGNRTVCLPAGMLMQQLVLKNQIILGSVNASPMHYKMAVEDLEKSRNKWGRAIEKVITGKLKLEEYKKGLFEHQSDEIKTVICWDSVS